MAERCKAVWADTPHPQDRELSIADVLQVEREHLMGMPAPFDGYVERPARVSSTCLVTVARNKPCPRGSPLLAHSRRTDDDKFE